MHKEFRGRADGLVSEDFYLDRERGGCFSFLTDPEASSITAIHTNQAGLGGGSLFLSGPISWKTDPQTSSIISSGGTAVGNVIGAALKTTIKP